MRVAITGASGLIGSALARSLEHGGHEVVRLVRGRTTAAGQVGWDPIAGRLDPGDLVGVDGVVHLAGAGIGDRRWTRDRRREILESRTKSTALLAAVLPVLEPSPAVLLSGSAIGYYGDRGDDTLTELSGPGSGFLAEVCQAWEAEAAPVADAGIRTVLLRTGIVQSADAGALAKVLPLYRLGLGGRLGTGRNWWSWITIGDEVRAIRHLLDSSVSGPVNLVSPNPVTNADHARTLARVLNRPAFAAVPRFAPRLALGAELADELLFSSQRVVPAALLDDGFTFDQPDLEPALRQLLRRSRSG